MVLTSTITNKIWGNSRKIITPFCLDFRLEHFSLSSNYSKIVFNKLGYRL